MGNNINKLAGALSGFSDIGNNDNLQFEASDKTYNIVYFQIPSIYAETIKSKADDIKTYKPDYSNTAFLNDSIIKFRNLITKKGVKLPTRINNKKPTSKGRKGAIDKDMIWTKTSYSLTIDNINFMYDYMYYKICSDDKYYTKAKFLIEVIDSTK